MSYESRVEVRKRKRQGRRTDTPEGTVGQMEISRTYRVEFVVKEFLRKRLIVWSGPKGQ